MKKILFFASALAGIFLAGSCQKEKLESYANGSVTYTITLPETVQTKGEGGYAEYDLYYEVYKTVDAAELEKATPLFEKKMTFSAPSTSVPLELLNDQDYTILFWANKKDQKWFDTENLRNVKMLESASNNEDRDAFCGMDEIVNQNGTLSRTVELKRPFAQLNISTVVPETPEFDVTPLSAMVKVKYIPVAYNVATAKPVGEDVEVTYADKEIPEAYIATDYTKVAMNYLLVPEGTIDVYYEITTKNGVVQNIVPNVPVKANYRTNIMGNLLTSDATYTVNVSDGFEDSESETLEVIADGIAKLQSTGEYQISNANGLVYASKNLFGKEDGSYVLTSDIDMSEYAAVETKAGDKFWEPVEISHKTFAFDGNGHSISNLPGMLVRSTIWGDLTFKNLTLNNPKIAYDVEDISSNKGVGAFFGFSDAFNKILLENCHVKGGEIAGGHWTGGLIGYAAGYAAESALTIKNCSVKDAKITGKGSCGGIIGHANGGTGSVEMNTISVFSSTIESTGTDTNKAGSVMGTVGSATVKVTNCSVIDNKVTSNDVENAKLWGRQGSSTGVLYVDGVQVEDFGVFTPSTTITVTNDEELAKAIAVAEFKVIKLASGTYSNDIKLTVAELGDAVRDIKFEAAEAAEPVIAGTVTLGYFENRVGATAWEGKITFDGITFDHANPSTHSLSIQNLKKGLVLENCTVIGDGEYGISAPGSNPTGQSSINKCTFVNAGLQLGGNYATDLIIEDSKFDESCINVQGGNGVTIQNCSFENTLTNAHIAQSFYLIRSNATPITVKNCVIAIDSELSEVATDQASWGILWNRREKDWTVENVAVTLSDAALMQTGLLVTKCSSTGKINTTNLTVNGKVYASTAAQLTAAVNNGATDIVLAGEFEMPSSGTTNAIQFTSLNGTAVIDNTKGSYWEAATLTFNNVNFKTGTGKVNGNGADYAALYSKNVTYNSCTFTGPMRLGRDGAKFNACTFNGLGNDYVWTYGNAASFDGCTFNTEGKAILIYSDGPTVEHGAAPAVSVTNCTFNATQGAKAGAIVNQNCAAVEIHNYGNGVTLTTSGNTVDEDFSGVWRIKTYETRFSESKIFVNGIEYTTIALDGKTMTIDGDKNVTVE